MSNITHRSEILFLYDVAYANPNGDPNDENKPRIDEETGVNIVTDVRLKRTVRDYLHEFKNEEIFIREIRDDDGFLQDAKTRALDFLTKDSDLEGKSYKEQQQMIKQNILNSCIDARLFGATIPLELKVDKKNAKGSITLTGPVQFRMGHSLHRVSLHYLKGTGAFADSYSPGKGKRQFTFREEYVLPYSLIGFWGVINENAGKLTQLTSEDIDMLVDALWNGTKNLISRTKVGQVPRLLLKINYSKPHFFIGDLDHKVALVSDKRDEELRNISDIKLDLTNLLSDVRQNTDAIESVEYKIDSGLNCVVEDQSFDISKEAKFNPFNQQF